VERATISETKGGLLGVFRRWSLAWLYLPLVALVGIPLITGEEFPFSPFPMYNQWNKESYLIYFRDRDGEPVPIQVMTSYNAGRYRKMFDKQLRAQKKALQADGHTIKLMEMTPAQMRSSGIWVLDWMDQSVAPGRIDALAPRRPLTVVFRKLELVDGEIRHFDSDVASDTDRPSWAQTEPSRQ